MNMIELQDRLKGFSQEQLIKEMQAPSGQAPQFMVLSEINRRKQVKDSYAAQQSKQGAPTVAEEVVASAGVPQAGLPQMASAMAPKSSMAQNTGVGSLPVQRPPQAGVQGMAAGGPVGGMNVPEMLRGLMSQFGSQFGSQGSMPRPGYGVPTGPSKQFTGALASTRSPGAMINARNGEDHPRGGLSVWKMAEGGITSDPALKALAQRMGLTVEQYLQQAGSDQAGRIEADAARRARRDRLMGLEPTGDGATFPTQGDLNQRYAEERYGFGPAMPASSPPDAPPKAPASIAPPMQPAVPGRMWPDFDPGNAPIVPGVNGGSWLDFDATGSAPADDPTVRAYLAAGIDPATISRNAYEGQAAAPELVGGAAGMMNSPEMLLANRDMLEDIKDGGMSLPPAPAAISRLGPAPDRSGLPGNDTHSLGPNSLSRMWDDITSLIGSTVKIGPDGQVSLEAAEDDPGLSIPPYEDVPPAEVTDPTVVNPDGTPATNPAAPAAGSPSYDVSVAGGAGGGGGGGGGGGSGGGAGGAAAGASGGYMSELEKALARAERTKEQDKWLSLAQAGLALMSSTQPTLGGAIGEAGQAGLAAFRSGRDENEKSIMGLHQAIAAQKAAAAKAAAGGGRRGGGGGAPSIEKYLKGLDAYSDSLYVTTTDEIGNKVTAPIEGAQPYLDEINRRRIAAISAGMGYTPTDFDATRP
ncbi:MAG: hypothetical protein QM805_07775 [Pseudomonas sp.]